jgi:hypothetical protein
MSFHPHHPGFVMMVVNVNAAPDNHAGWGVPMDDDRHRHGGTDHDGC